MSNNTNTGIPNPDRPGHWLVPPWPTNASFSDVVGHFLRFHPWGDPSIAQLLAYSEGYQAALEATPPEEPTCAARRRWREDMRKCVDRCARLYREEVNGNVSTLPAVAQPHRRTPAQQLAS